MILGIAAILLAAMLLVTMLGIGDIFDGYMEWWEPAVSVLGLAVAIAFLVGALCIPLALFRFGLVAIFGGAS